jgi:small multidrug resistance pump
MIPIQFIYLTLAIAFEVTGTTFMKLSDGLSNLRFTAVMLIFYLLSLSLLSLALKEIEVGVAYAIWSGVGIALIATIGILFFQESPNIEKMAFIGLIIVGAIGLNISGAGH